MFINCFSCMPGTNEILNWNHILILAFSFSCSLSWFILVKVYHSDKCIIVISGLTYYKTDYLFEIWYWRCSFPLPCFNPLSNDCKFNLLVSIYPSGVSFFSVYVETNGYIKLCFQDYACNVRSLITKLMILIPYALIIKQKI